MASFTESATLKLVDQTSANAKKINSSLTKLFATANKLKSVGKIDIKISATGATKASRDVRKLTTDISKLRKGTVALKVNLQGSAKALTDIRKLSALTAKGTKPINLKVNTTQLDSAIRKIGVLRAAASGATAIGGGKIPGARSNALRGGSLTGQLLSLKLDTPADFARINEKKYADQAAERIRVANQGVTLAQRDLIQLESRVKAGAITTEQRAYGDTLIAQGSTKLAAAQKHARAFTKEFGEQAKEASASTKGLMSIFDAFKAALSGMKLK